MGLRIGFDDERVVSTARGGGTQDVDPYDALRAVQLAKDEVLLLIDASGLCYRAYHTRQGLEGRDGSPTGTLHGVLQMVRSLCSAANTRRWLLVWDGSVANKRMVHPRYKSRHDRKRTPEEQADHDDMRAQAKLAREVLATLGCPMLHDQDCEADDLISVLAAGVGRMIEMKHASLLNLARPLTGTIVVSDDKDMYQTLSPTNRVWRSTIGRLVSLPEFVADHGFPPRLYDSYKALVGEPATGDDIPGVTGIGDVNAAKMVGAHGDLEAMIAAAAKMAQSSKCPKTYMNLCREKDAARLSRRLSRTATTVAELESEWGVPATRVSPKTIAALKDAVSVNRVTPKSAVGQLRGRFGFSQSFDALAWQSVCGFVIKEINDVSRAPGAGPGKTGTGRSVVGGRAGSPVSPPRPQRVHGPAGTSVDRDDGEDGKDDRGKAAAEDAPLMVALRMIAAKVAETDIEGVEQLKAFSFSCPKCGGGELKVWYGGPRAIRAVCSTPDCLKFMS